MATTTTKNKGGRPKGRKNNATLAKEGKPIPPPPKQNEPPQPSTPTLDEEIARLRATAEPAPAPQQAPPGEQQKAPPPAGEQQKAPPAGEQQQAPPPGEQQQQAPPPPKGFTLSGHVGLIVIDAFIAGGIALLLRRYAKVDVSKSDLQLTEQEVEQLTPIADEVAKMVVANPVVLLTIALAGCYMSKIPALPKREKEEPQTA